MPVYNKAKKQNPNKGKKPGGGASPRPGGPNRGGYAGAPPGLRVPPGMDLQIHRDTFDPNNLPPPGYDNPNLPSLMPKLDMGGGGFGEPPGGAWGGPADDMPMPGGKPGPGGGMPIGDVGDSPGGGGMPTDWQALKPNFGSSGPLGMTDLMARVRGGMPDMGPAAVGAPMDPLMLALLRLQMQR